MLMPTKKKSQQVFSRDLKAVSKMYTVEQLFKLSKKVKTSERVRWGHPTWYHNLLLKLD